jgi:NADP-dependent 3-hydroxy acid dehydrogenase YdfG
MPVSLNNQVALVIGASSGIGRATAAQLAREGVSVMAAARRKNRLRELEKELSEQGLKIAVSEADAVNVEDMQRLANETRARFGKIDILVYATGTNTPDRSLRRLSPPIWDELIQVNLNGAYYATQAVLPEMREARSGHLIYVSSISGLAPDVSGAAYQAAKRGLVGLSHAIRMEERENGIRTCVVCPGLVNTEILEKRPVKPTEETLAKALLAEDVAELIVDIAKLNPRVDIPEVQILPTYL